jgi:hypothetical protein
MHVNWYVTRWLFQVYDQVIKCLFLKFKFCEQKAGASGSWYLFMLNVLEVFDSNI